jgi:hypothetical protein
MVSTFVVNSAIDTTIGGTTIAARDRRSWPREKRGQGFAGRRPGNVIRS